jgi:hypothetical protein
MKKLQHLYFILVLFAISCEKDEIPSCNCGNNNSDKICSEYLFENEEAIGYINYEYDNNDVLIKKSYFNKNGCIKKASYYEYLNNKQTIETIYKTTNSIDYIRLYNYNSFDSISSIICERDGKEFSKITFEYNDTQNRTKEDHYSDNNLVSIIAFEYDTDGVLNKIKTLDQNNNLQSLKMYSFYLENVTKINHFDSKSNYLGNDVFRFDNKNQLLNAYHYGSKNNLINYEIGDLENGLLAKKTVYNSENNAMSFSIFKYY